MSSTTDQDRKFAFFDVLPGGIPLPEEFLEPIVLEEGADKISLPANESFGSLDELFDSCIDPPYSNWTTEELPWETLSHSIEPEPTEVRDASKQIDSLKAEIRELNARIKSQEDMLQARAEQIEAQGKKLADIVLYIADLVPWTRVFAAGMSKLVEVNIAGRAAQLDNLRELAQLFPLNELAQLFPLNE